MVTPESTRVVVNGCKLHKSFALICARATVGLNVWSLEVVWWSASKEHVSYTLRLQSKQTVSHLDEVALVLDKQVQVRNQNLWLEFPRGLVEKGLVFPGDLQPFRARLFWQRDIIKSSAVENGFHLVPLQTGVYHNVIGNFVRFCPDRLPLENQSASLFRRLADEGTPIRDWCLASGCLCWQEVPGTRAFNALVCYSAWASYRLSL